MVRIPVVPVVLLSLTCSFAFISSCKSPDALVQLDVVGDQAFDGVNLTLSTGGTRKVFPGVSFSPSRAFAAGMYLPSSITGSVDIIASVDNGVCTNGAGQVTIPVVSSGNITPPVLLTIHGTACAPLPDAGTGMGGDNRGAGGGGGISAGTGGSPGGQGGMIGVGGSPNGQGGGPGGATGTGGIVGTGVGGVIGGGTGGVGNGAGGTTGGTGGAAGCGDLVDDMEADTGKICEGSGRAGHWFTYIDALTGSTITPPTTQVPALPYQISPPRGSSQYAMRAFGTYGSYAGIAALVNNSVIGATPKTFDASRYTGVRFTAKGSGGIKLVVQTSATESSTYGGTCTLASCYGATYIVPGVAVDTWGIFSVPFTSLTRGNAAFNPGDVWSIEFQPSALGSFDIWIDDVMFY